MFRIALLIAAVFIFLWPTKSFAQADAGSGPTATAQAPGGGGSGTAFVDDGSTVLPQAESAQALALLVIPLILWSLRRLQASPAHLFHTKGWGWGSSMVAGFAGSLTPALDNGHLLTYRAFGMLLATFIMSKLAQSNPSAMAVGGTNTGLPTDFIKRVATPLGTFLIAGFFLTSCGCYTVGSKTYDTASCVQTRAAAKAEVKCVLSALPAEVISQLPAVTAILTGQAPDWAAQLDALKTNGGGLMDCSVQAAVAQLSDGIIAAERVKAASPPNAYSGIVRGVSYLKGKTLSEVKTKLQRTNLTKGLAS